LGIGTASPSRKLSVSGTIGASNYLIDAASAGTVGILSDTCIEMFGASSSQIMVFKVNGNTERMRIDSAGNVGIANSSPSYLLDSGSNAGAAALIRGQGSFLARKASFPHNGAGNRTIRVTVTLNNLQFINIFLDASAHRFDNGGSWQVARYAMQLMIEGGTVRLNQRMPNYEYGGSTTATFTVGNPPSWTYVGGTTHYFDVTVAANMVSYFSIICEGPGVSDATLTQVA
jgi:hypothetical protein